MILDENAQVTDAENSGVLGTTTIFFREDINLK
jgi:hypothetical protein